MMTAPFNALKMQQKFIGKYTFAPSVLYHGARMASFTAAASISTRLTVNHVLLHQITAQDPELKHNVTHQMGCAFLGGMSSSFFYPPSSLGDLDLTKQIVAEKGYAGFYSCSLWRASRVVSGVTMLSFFVPWVKSKLEPVQANPHGFFSASTNQPRSKDKPVADASVTTSMAPKK